MWGRCCNVALGQRDWSKSREIQWKRVGEKIEKEEQKCTVGMIRELVGGGGG